MSQKDFDTKALWSTFMLLVSGLFIFLILAFGYVSLEDSIKDYLNKPRYSKEDLLAMAEKRKIQRRKERADNWDLVENGIHVKTGLKDDEDLDIIISSCTSCHSSKLITQNRATKEGWKNMIVWMQETQGLGDLGSNEPKIINYLAKHYAPEEVGRRQNLPVEEIKWYVLELEE